MGGAGGPQQQQQQLYCLRWNQHRNNLLNAFDQLLQAEALTDVTLSCGGASIKCHRIVLAACSGYFQSLFVNDAVCLGAGAAQQHPIVVFKDIALSELKAILEFIYRGEVSVAQEQVGALLKAAESLKVKGLFTEEGSNSPAGLSGLSFEPLTSGHSTSSSGFLPQLMNQTHHNQSNGSAMHTSTSASHLIQMPSLFKHSPGKTPERTGSSLDKERDGSSSSETNQQEDEREDSLSDRVKSSRSPVFDPLKDIQPASSISFGTSKTTNSGRPELKRYRQYTRHDIAAAIEAVRSGQSALQASRLYGVPSRTLYDKVKKLGIVTGRPYRQSIALAVSLAQAQNANMPQMNANSPGSRNGSVGPDDDDSMDVHHNLLHHHLHQQRAAAAAAAAAAGHFRRRANSLEELSLYFSPAAAAAAAAAAELAMAQNRPASAEADEDDAGSAGSGPIVHAAAAPIDLSQNYERMMRPGSGIDSADGQSKTAELLAEKSA